ncbi:MAG TPA: hypothetical protein VGU22_09650 [Methylomirabilota bacterium]|nr:hypothetical protein [Methylomirabilota bacterium]
MTEEPQDHNEVAKAERQLRMAMAAEARRERDQREMIKKGFFGCLGIGAILFLLAMFFL